MNASESSPPRTPSKPQNEGRTKTKSKTVTSPYFKRCRHKSTPSDHVCSPSKSRPQTRAGRSRKNDENETSMQHATVSNTLVSFQPRDLRNEVDDVLAPAHATAMDVSNLPSPQGPNSDAEYVSIGQIKAEEVVIGEEDVKWYMGELVRLKDPLYSFFLRKYTRLYLSLWQAKPQLVQELVAHDPWTLLVAVMFLNKTAGKVAIPILWDVLSRWPTPEAMSEADVSKLKALITCLGLQDTRAKRLIAMSKTYITDPPRTDLLRNSTAYLVPVKDELTGQKIAMVKQRYPPTPISHLPGTGPYAMDSYRIFCLPGDEWKSVMPADKELIKYMRWKWAFHEQQRWDPVRGVIGEIHMDEIEALPAALVL